ncbi:Arabinose 5-phosphate isomerase KdsD [Rosistilla oblonga]|uniref:KpsF/GutQ family sugar-phosphate isomerase n=1 Tax=Rosistilla oblonga TaxID=2527990 RepID=UPI001188CDA7|nr:KpsF/GutQ family sugar-phosphate isomerase [Rosistilla oblonga]QDV11424.1 Arabinose 5-phosphate isomerase KdsD [Rosistilla oblonga]
MSAQPIPKPAGDCTNDSLAAATPIEQLRFARNVIRVEGQHLTRLAAEIDQRIVAAANQLLACKGSVIISGIGKAGIIGQKLSATLSSTGTRSHFLHSAEAVHGDLGKVQADDVVVLLSHSGKTEEVVRLLPALSAQSQSLIAITASANSPLGQGVDLVIEIGSTQEVCTLGLAPSTSTTAMLAVCDALALLTSELRGFTSSDFARYHPGGSLGQKLSSVDDVMRPVGQCRIASDSTSVRDVLVMNSKSGRRSGAVMLTDQEGRLSGIFTDSDLARLLERRRERALDGPIVEVMSSQVTRVRSGSLLADAIQILAQRRISELPVTDANQRPVGLIDITDIVSLLPNDEPNPPQILPMRPQV